MTIENSRLVDPVLARRGSARFLEYTSQEPNSNRVGEFAIGTNIAISSVIGKSFRTKSSPGCISHSGIPTRDTRGPPELPDTPRLVGRPFDVWFDDDQIMADSKFLI